MEDNVLLKNGREQTFVPQFASIADLLKHHVESFGNKEAIVGLNIDENEEQTLSYSRLAELAYQTANYLFKKGISKSDRVAFALENTFAENLEKKEKEVVKQEIATQETDKKCPECEKPLLIRSGRYGKFYACSGFPECKHTSSLEENQLHVPCPKCETGLPAGRQGQLTEKRTKKKKIFYGCSRYPECDYALWYKPTGDKCDKCNSLLIETAREKIKCSNKDCETNKK